MRLYKQRTKTDCLLTVAENWVQKPREKLGRQKWFKTNHGKMLTYSSFVKNVEQKRLKFKGAGDIYLDETPALLGGSYFHAGEWLNHAFFWNGRDLIEPHELQKVELSRINLVYAFLARKNKTPECFLHVKKLAEDWDNNCRISLKQKSEYRPDSFMGIHHSGKYYSPKSAIGTHLKIY